MAANTMDTVPGQPLSRQAREQQLLAWMRDDPMQIYDAYLRAFGSGDADAPTLTPLGMVRTLIEHEFPHADDA